MTEEKIRQLANEYTKEYVPRFQKVAEQAYIDGMLDAMKYMREKLLSL